MYSAGGADRFRRRLRDLPDRTPLRIKMITAVLALVIIALAVCSFVSRVVFEDYLQHQASTQLTSFYQKVEQLPPDRIDRYLYLANGNEQVWLLDSRGQQVGVLGPGGTALNSGGPPPPQIPTNQAWLTANAGKQVNVTGQSGEDWLVITQQIPNVPVTITATGAQTLQTVTLVVGYDLGNISQSINYLTEIDLLVSAAVVIVLALVGVAVVRASLRPLRDIEQTAAAIAGGDLSSRVPDRDPRTEVGRLGRSLNAMLSQIETAFDARTRSEEAARQSERRMRQFLGDASHELRTPLTAIRGFAEYYRQRGGVAELPDAPGRPALTNGADQASPAALNAADQVPPEAAAADQVPPGPPDAAEQASPEAPTADASARADVPPARTADAPPTSLPAEGTTANGGGQLHRADLDRIMQRVEQESSRMGVLVEDMLLLARLDQQRALDQRPVDMLTLAADAVHDARVVAPRREISLTVGTGAALIVLGDEVRLRQVIGNLMTNAINHTPDGTPIRVHVRSGSLDEWRTAAPLARAAPWAAPGGSPVRTALAVAGDSEAPAVPAAVVEIADSGPGLTPQQAEHVFERFYRADQARTRKAGGAGLGLSIVAALVAAHGGTVWVESQPGSGATFRIAIPLTPEARNSGPEPDDGDETDVIGSELRLIRQHEPADPHAPFQPVLRAGADYVSSGPPEPPG
jgi:two-component system, OmpR family, sensor kinase